MLFGHVIVPIPWPEALLAAAASALWLNIIGVADNNECPVKHFANCNFNLTQTCATLSHVVAMVLNNWEFIL
jgi:hypothetical protein